ncbi:MAG: CooT family nickel-binding protein [Desulfobacca sp.]|uniref:CooT family nickel-binding protein n=1 Tax=Desulfobacca sp. TaxID=2067990 RepID=UPI004049955D
MCEATAFMLINGREEVLLPDVDIIAPEGDDLRLVSIFGEQKVVRATFHQLRLSEHKIILRPK